MKTNETRPLDGVASCLDVPDRQDPMESTFAPELQPGKVLDGRFIISKAISRSGMATIYQAQDLLS